VSSSGRHHLLARRLEDLPVGSGKGASFPPLPPRHLRMPAVRGAGVLSFFAFGAGGVEVVRIVFEVRQQDGTADSRVRLFKRRRLVAGNQSAVRRVCWLVQLMDSSDCDLSRQQRHYSRSS